MTYHRYHTHGLAYQHVEQSQGPDVIVNRFVRVDRKTLHMRSALHRMLRDVGIWSVIYHLKTMVTEGLRLQ
jgi:hypothetical protein